MKMNLQFTRIDTDIKIRSILDMLIRPKKDPTQNLGATTLQQLITWEKGKVQEYCFLLVLSLRII